MKHFYETYRQYPKLSTLLRELGWSSHLHIMSKTKSIAEYKTKLIPRKVLQKKLHELFLLNEKNKKDRK